MGASVGKDCGLVSVLCVNECSLVAQCIALHAQSSALMSRRISARLCLSDCS